MKRILLCLVTLLCGHLLFAAGSTGNLTDHTFMSGGVDRSYKLYLPAHLAPGAPLVFVLHGYGGSADPERFDMDSIADKYGFAVCYPQGARDKRGKTCWNVGYPFQDDMTIDDVAFICELAQHLQQTYRLSARNTFCTGYSNGGEMCYLLAYKCPQVFKAVAPIAGLTLEWMYRELEADRPIPLLEIHGTKDKTSMWNGDPENRGGWGEYIAVPLAVSYWATQNRCTHEETDTIASLNPESGHSIIRHKYVGGTDGHEVWLYEITGGTHSWGEKDLVTGEHIWQFFSRFVEPEKTAVPQPATR